MAVLEAIQQGAIPVITRECNLPEMFAGGIAVRIASDFSDFESTLVGLLSLPAHEQRRMSAAAAAFSGRYRWSNIAAAVAAQYDSILAHGHLADEKREYAP